MTPQMLFDLLHWPQEHVALTWAPLFTKSNQQASNYANPIVFPAFLSTHPMILTNSQQPLTHLWGVGTNPSWQGKNVQTTRWQHWKSGLNPGQWGCEAAARHVVDSTVLDLDPSAVGTGSSYPIQTHHLCTPLIIILSTFPAPINLKENVKIWANCVLLCQAINHTSGWRDFSKQIHGLGNVSMSKIQELSGPDIIYVKNASVFPLGIIHFSKDLSR